MPILMNCTNKGCGQYQEPYYDASDNNVYCSLCNKTIDNVTQFSKNTMKSSKQVKKKAQVSYSVKCTKCNNEDRPKLVGNEIVCSNCNNQINNISSIYKDLLKQKLKDV